MEPCLESQGRALKEQMRLWLLEWAGERCADFDPGCYCCDSWQAWDRIFVHVGDACGDPACPDPICVAQSSSSSVRSNP